jgi:hypothetical protein
MNTVNILTLHTQLLRRHTENAVSKHKHQQNESE